MTTHEFLRDAYGRASSAIAKSETVARVHSAGTSAVEAMTETIGRGARGRARALDERARGGVGDDAAREARGDGARATRAMGRGTTTAKTATARLAVGVRADEGRPGDARGGRGFGFDGRGLTKRTIA